MEIGNWLTSLYANPDENMVGWPNMFYAMGHMECKGSDHAVWEGRVHRPTVVQSTTGIIGGS